MPFTQPFIRQKEHTVGIDSHALALAIANAAKFVSPPSTSACCTEFSPSGRFDSRLKAYAVEEAAVASASAHQKPGGYRVKRGDIERALNRAVAFENQMEQMIVDEKAEADKQLQLKPKSAVSADKLALLAQQEKRAQMAAISSALEQV